MPRDEPLTDAPRPETPAEEPAAGSTDGAPAPAAPAGESAEELRSQLTERGEQYLRLAADFENFRRRKTQELADRSRYASEEAASQLVPVLDNLQRALASAPEGEGGPLIEGVRMVAREFESALERIGVTPIESLGQPFDPAVHEAVGGEESDEVTVDTVSAEYQRGWRLHDKVLRPSMVRVAHPRPVAAPRRDAE